MTRDTNADITQVNRPAGAFCQGTDQHYFFLKLQWALRRNSDIEVTVCALFT